MTSQRSFVRKIIYFSLIGLLLLPLYWLSLPATTRSEGGKLAQIRKAHNLSQANLGEIDPTSVTLKLSTLGLDGIAVNLLWSTAIDAKEREDWTTFGAALKQITNLQPHFPKVWQFQAHNVSFNISYEFDDYHDRYHYVIKGIELLELGTRYNDRNPRLVRDLAHFIGFKIGRSDEADFYRPMFRDDKDFHGVDRMKGTRYEGRPSTLTDNWQVSKWWYQWVDRLLDTKLASYTTLSPVVVHSEAPHTQIQYAKSLEEDGHFDQQALDEWRKAAAEWNRFGLRRLRTGQGFSIQLAEYQEQKDKTNKVLDEFNKLAATEPEVRAKLDTQRREALSDEERAVLAMPSQQRTPQQQALVQTAKQKLVVDPKELAAALSKAHREEAVRLAERYEDAQARLDMIEKYRDIINYEYWRVRCDVECMRDTVDARKAIYEGDQAYAASDLTKALSRYNVGVAGWKKVIEEYPRLLSEKTMIMELMQIVDKYKQILSQNDQPLPSPFPLQTVLDQYKKQQAKDGTEAN